MLDMARRHRWKDKHPVSSQIARLKRVSSRIRHWLWLVLAIIALAVSLIPLPNDTTLPESHILQITASQYEFNPGVFKVNEGDSVTIELESADVVHSLYLDDYDIEMIGDPGQISRHSFVADRSGIFRFRCSVTCGPLHPFMIGKLQVGNNNLLWRGLALSVLAIFVGVWKVRQ